MFLTTSFHCFPPLLNFLTHKFFYKQHSWKRVKNYYSLPCVWLHSWENHTPPAEKGQREVDIAEPGFVFRIDIAAPSLTPIILLNLRLIYTFSSLQLANWLQEKQSFCKTWRASTTPWTPTFLFSIMPG